MYGRMAAAALAVFACLAAGAAPARQGLTQEDRFGERVLYDFEESAEHWKLLTPEGEAGAPCAASADRSHTGRQSLRVDVTLPGISGAFVQPPADRRNWHPFTDLLLSVRVPETAPDGVQLIVYLKDSDLRYYQCVRRRPLRRGAWTAVALDLTARSTDWTPMGHYRPWDGYVRQEVLELGVKLVSRHPYRGPFHLDAVLLRRDATRLPKRNAIYNLRADKETVERYDRFELSFNLARSYANPFDPDIVDVQGRFIRPDGSTVSVPGFFYQGYLRRRKRGAENLVAMGRSCWKIRFAPRRLGTYHYQVEVKDRWGVIRSYRGHFRCVEGGGRGFVRLSREDPFYFEFDDGSFYYPIGHNIAAVHDARARPMGVEIHPSEGTYAYDRFLRRMAENGENFGRIWMTPWSFGIEWTKAYDVHYGGLGRYNLRNAWRLDHVLHTAREQGVCVMLLFTAHGEIGDYESDFWGHDREQRQGSPYWTGCGGPLADPKELYTSKEALELYKKKARYIVARWGYSTAVMAWEILNEPDLPGFYQQPGPQGDYPYGKLGAEFVQAVARHIKQLDPADHLITSGCFRFWQPWALPTMSLPELDFNTAHSFDANLESTLRSHLELMHAKFGKILLPTEAGLTPFAQDPERTALAIHRTLWASHMMPSAGVAAPWWWVLIDRRDLYFHFRALAAFARGQDRRGKGYRAGIISVADAAGERSLSALVLENGREALCWVFEPAAFTSRGSWREAQSRAATVTVRRIAQKELGLEPGAYRVEVWDTYEGQVVEILEATAEQDGLTFQTPAFARDLACKITPR